MRSRNSAAWRCCASSPGALFPDCLPDAMPCAYMVAGLTNLAASPLFHKLWRLALGPGIIVHAEMNTVFHCGVVKEQEYIHRIGIRVHEYLLPKHLIRYGASLAGVGNNSVRNFQAVNVRLIFLIAAVGIADGICSETEKRDEKQQGRKSGPIPRFAHSPGVSPLREQPANGSITE